MTFDDKIAKLNSGQLKAVETIEGPVMVIAGPGTGKTEILSLRIGNILRKTDAAPGNILCLTYTDAAASEMRHRLIDYIGPEAYGLQVSTFHSFCNLVIQENPGTFQQARELEPISEIDRFNIIKTLIDRFGDDHPLKRFKGQTYYEWKKLNDLFMTMKRENWSPKYMHAQIDEFVERMKTHEKYIYKRKYREFQAGDLKIKPYEAEILAPMKTLHAAVDEYEHYNALMAEEGKYDFEDMLLWVYNAFDQDEDFLAGYQERFLYVLVDEFQDTNGIQLGILQKLLDHEWIDRPNVFVVGDDDQAIFRFQGANIKNLMDFQAKYNPEIVLLEENYRSSQRILDTARIIMNPVSESVIQKLFNQSKKLIASGKYATRNHPVHITAYPTMTYENADIFRQIKQWHEEKTQGSFAVLYNKHAHGRDLSMALKGAGIPFQIAKTNDALGQQIILHLIDIITCIGNLSEGAANDDALLYRVLHLVYLDPRPDDLQRLILSHTARERLDNSTLFMWLSDPQILDQLNLRDRPWMDHVNKVLGDSITAYHSKPLLAFIEWVVHQFGLMQWILAQQEKFSHLYALKTFFNFVDQQSVGNSKFSVPELLETLHLMKTYGIVLPVQSLAPPPKGIFLSTLHSAKGLEYEKVIIKNVTNNEWEEKVGGAQSFKLPDNLVRQNADADSVEDESDISDQDRRRLLYVGMTRAKHDLSLTYPRKKDEGKDLTPSLYLTEIRTGDEALEASSPEVDENLQAEYLAALMSGENKVDLQLDTIEIEDRIRNFVMNVSALNVYLECPLRFYYDKILMIPSTQSVSMLFGSGLHEALQYFFRKRFEEKDSSTGKEYMLKRYDFYMERNKHRFTEKEFIDLITYGRKVLDQYYDHYHDKWSEDVQYLTEYRCKDIHIQGVPVKGFIDRIDKTENKIVVYDYKSGKTEYEFKKKTYAPSESNPDGGSYWRQMVFYDLMLQQDPKFKTLMDHGYIQGLEPKKDGSFEEKKFNISPDDREFVAHQLKEVYQKIQNKEFSTGCGECEWCRMHAIEKSS